MFLVGFVAGVCVLGAGLWLYGQYLAKKQANNEKGGDK